MKVLADTDHTLSPLLLLQMIKSARGTDDEIGLMMSTVTVGEANAKIGQDRALSWAVAVCLSFILIAGSTVVAYLIYSCPLLTVGSPWLVLPATKLWGVYMAAVAVVMVCMDLFLPHAPVALRDAFLDVGWMWVGVPLMLIDHFVVYFGHDWMVIAMVFLLAALIAGVLAFWVWLVGIYRK